MDYANDRYWALDKQIKKIQEEKYFKTTYKGKTTRRARRLQKLESNKQIFEIRRWRLNNLPISIRKCFKGWEFDFEEACLL